MAEQGVDSPGDEDRVSLTDLDVITRYSLAVRTATADREDLIAALRADLTWLEGGRIRRPAPAGRSASRRQGGQAATARKATAAKATQRRR